jgi:hypothetical protein
MITIRLEGFDEAIQRFRNAGKSAPGALAAKLNDLAFDIRDAEMETIQKVFKHPKPQTVRNFRVFKGSASKPGATIAFDNIYNGDFLIPEIEGGQRKKKGSERMLGHYYVPGAGAIIDEFGNISGQQLVQILSYLQLFGETGYKANRTISRTQAIRKNMNDYFVLDKPTNGLAAGVYLRVPKGQGQMLYTRAMANKPRGTKKLDYREKLRRQLERGVIPILIFVNKPPTYRKRFPFYDVAQQVIAAKAPAMLQDVVKLIL